jgi:hypothetical protein
MEAENDVMNLIVKKAHKANPINVKHMEEETVVMNRTVIQSQ